MSRVRVEALRDGVHTSGGRLIKRQRTRVPKAEAEVLVERKLAKVIELPGDEQRQAPAQAMDLVLPKLEGDT